MIEHLQCPLAQNTEEQILLAHGEGARLSRRLIRDVMARAFDNELLRPMADGATLPANDSQLVMTTDSYVVSPLFFAGSDIGKLAVYGTINDVAVCGAEPLYLSVALIIEEGLSRQTLSRVVDSIATAASVCGVRVVTGDTKVVPRHAADGLFVNTTGIGRLRPNVEVGVHRIRPGDRILVSGTVGNHGIAVLASREQLGFASDLLSDAAPLHRLVEQLLANGIDIHFMRDPTRGGVSAVLHEIVESTGLSAVINERDIPLSDSVRGACELLGLDPLYVANEGKLLLIVAADQTQQAINCLHEHELGRNAALIGEVVSSSSSDVYVRGPLGILRVLDEPSGAPLPRIC